MDLRLELDAANAFSVRHDHALPGCGVRLDHLLIGPMGVFVLSAARPGRLGRIQQKQHLRSQVRAVRAVLDAAGLCALQAGALLCLEHQDGRPLRFANDVGVGDIEAVLAYLASDRAHGPLVGRDALIALDPPPFIADVRRELPATPRPSRVSVPAATT